MTNARSFIVIFLVMMLSACSDTRQSQSVKSLPDNPENRTVAAKRYLEVMPPKDMLRGLASRVGQAMPEKDRKQFVEIMEGPELEKTAYRLTLDGLVKHFTVDELNAMVAFYGSPEGQSAVKKFGPLMTEVMPQIQQEVKKALAQIQPPPESKEVPKVQVQPEPPKTKEQKAVSGKQ